MSKDLIPVSYSHDNILDTMETDELYDYCNHVYRQEEYDDAEDMMSDIMALEYFYDATFHALLAKYFEEKGKNIEDEVRGYMPYKKGFLMIHGVNYDWKDADLVGGSANGQTWKDFEKKKKKQGYELTS